MATLQNIRKRGPLIAIVVGLALFAFIVGDMVRGLESFGGKSKSNVAVINGEPLKIQEYEAKVQETEDYVKLMQGGTSLTPEMSNRIRSNVWERLVRQYILLGTVKKLGIGVHKDELSDMVMGTHIDPLVMQTIVNPETGRFDKNYLMNVLKNMDNDPTIKQIWMYIEKEVKEGRIYTKYFNLAQKGLYVTELEAKYNYEERNHIVDLEYVVKKYEPLDTTIAVSDKELRAYYEKHKNKYQQEESRDIVYLTYDVIPSKLDSSLIFNEIKGYQEHFDTTSNIEEYIGIKSDIPYQEKYFKKGELLNPMLDSLVFSNDSNFIYGPYLEGAHYTLAKFIEMDNTRPDTASARHILISPQNPAIGTMEMAKTIADSLKTLIDNGADFAELVMKHTADETSKTTAGKYENFTEGSMEQAYSSVPEFNQFCFENEAGHIDVIETPYGYDIIEVLEQSKPLEKRLVVFLKIEIYATQQTFDDVFNKASLFSGQNNTEEKFIKAIDEQGLDRKDATEITQATSVIPGIDEPREIVKWVFASKAGTVSAVLGSEDRYVVALLTKVREKGITPFEQKKDDITIEIRKEKKAEQIIADLEGQDINNLEAIAEKFSSRVMPAQRVSFNAFQIMGVGYEPAILALVSSLEENKAYGPIQGNNGVYVLKATSITPSVIPENYVWDNDRQRLTESLQQRVNSRNPTFNLFYALKTLAKIEDRRAKFF